MRTSATRACILHDDTEGGELLTVYNSITDVDFTKWSERNYEYLKLIYEGVPYRVIVYRMGVGETDYAGELPWRNIVGVTVPADISIAVEAAGHRISYGAYGYTGEVPWRNMQGTQRLEREPSVDVKSYPYQYDFCGTDFCGEEGV